MSDESVSFLFKDVVYTFECKREFCSEKYLTISFFNSVIKEEYIKTNFSVGFEIPKGRTRKLFFKAPILNLAMEVAILKPT